MRNSERDKQKQKQKQKDKQKEKEKEKEKERDIEGKSRLLIRAELIDVLLKYKRRFTSCRTNSPSTSF